MLHALEHIITTVHFMHRNFQGVIFEHFVVASYP